MSDRDELVAAIAANEPDAFARWLASAERRLRDSLHPFARRLDTEALMQETLLRVWQVVPRFVSDGRPDGLLRLAITIGHNLAVEQLRRERVEPMEIEALEAAALEEAARSRGQFIVRADPPGDPLLRQAIEDCRRRLPQKPALALDARLQSQGTEPDGRLAERLGMRKNTFLQNVTRARRLLADCLRRRGIDLMAEMA